MFRLRQLAAAATVTLAALSATSPATAAAATTTLSENDCVEVTVPRAVDLAETRELVPSRYGLFTQAGAGSSVVARLWVYTYTCQSITVDGVPAPGVDRPTTVSIGAVQLTTRDGEPVSGFATYVLWYATDNPVVFAQLRALDWPAQQMTPDTETAFDLGAPHTPSAAAWTVHAPGLDYELRALSTEPVPVVGGGDVYFFHDSERGDLQLVAHNLALASSPASVQGDLRGAGPLPDLLTNPDLALIPLGIGINPDGVYSAPGFRYTRGTWTSEVTRN